MNVWVWRSGRDEERDTWALERGLAGGGWHWMPDLSAFNDREDLKAAVVKYHPPGEEQALHAHTGELWAIAHDVSVGDIIVMPRRHNYSIALGFVTAPYTYLASNQNPWQRHVVYVNWIRHAVSRTTFSKQLNDALNAPRTIYRPRDEISVLLRRMAGKVEENETVAHGAQSRPASRAHQTPLEIEFSRRADLEKALGPGNGRWLVAASRLRELGLYGGASGIYVDANTTKHIRESGVTVSLRHNGRSYADALSDSVMEYRYPKTNRPPSRDANEIRATKAAYELELPVYVISDSSDLRDVRRGWVTGWDDSEAVFSIGFGDSSTLPVDLPSDYAKSDASSSPGFDGAPDREVQGWARREQRLARALLLGNRESGECRLCSREFLARFLVAAHKKRRSECSLEEKLDLQNVVMLCCVFGCDALFEHGYVTVASDGVLLVSKSCGPEETTYAKSIMRDKIEVAQAESKYFAWHKDWHSSTV